MGVLSRNLRLALRQLARNPGFTVTVVVTLALSIGANSAIFSVVNALMLKHLPYPQPERMGTIFMRVAGSAPSEEHQWIDGTQWELLRDSVPSVIGAVSSGMASGVNLKAGAQAQYVHDGRVSARYFEVLGVRPALGRVFTLDEDRPQGPPAVILSYHLWHTLFGGNPNLLGQAIQLKGEPYTVVGILPAGVHTPLDADLYTPLQPTRTGEGSGTNYEVIVRLSEGATWQQADSEINRAWAAEARRFAAEGPRGSVVTFHAVPLQQGQTAELRPQLLALMAAAGFILLIACANLAGLTLVRVARRTPEIATRLALGASNWQLQKQLWMENLVLAAVGGLAGIGVGYAALRGLLSLLPTGFLPVASVPLDLRVLAFTLAVALLTSILFGMLPALAVRRVDLRTSIASRAVAGRDRLRQHQALIAGEVALTVVLLAGSGLLIRTLIHLETLPSGFNANGLMTAKASLDDARYHDPAAFHRLLDESTAAMRQIPGVTNAGVALSLPYERILNDEVSFTDGPDAGQSAGTDMDYVTPGYFETLEAPLLAGRFFTTSDGPTTQPVAIVNRTFARKFFPGASPVGRTIRDGQASMRIVGVVADTPISSGLNPVAPLMSQETVYVPAAQMVSSAGLAMLHSWFQPSWVVRTAGPVSGLTEQMQHALSSAAPALPFSGFYSMTDLMHVTLAMQRVEVALLGAMAGLALLLSAVGIFALVASMVTQRTREIGIRIALGSSIERAMANVGAPGLRASAFGLVLGLLLCAGVLRILRSVLYGVAVYDATTLAAVVLGMAGIALLASAVPALRIARIDPARTLREE
ncbi:MAG TPA: ABC transporter permease [Terracidiphilus sp.]|jgi:predicted permease|nr:ABC transporter permease [Terracidiphilus sp.]